LARPYEIDHGALVPEGIPPQYALGGTMLSDVRELHAIRGTYTGDGMNESRLFMGMDSDLYIAMSLAYIRAIDDPGEPGWSRSPLQSNIAAGVRFFDYFRNSHDFKGPHDPFDWSDESKGGRTDPPGSPTAQIQFWSPHFYRDANGNPVYDWTPYGSLGRALMAVGRPGVENVTNPYVLEIDQDWDLFHRSDPTYGDFSQQYINNYGDFQPNWSPPCN